MSRENPSVVIIGAGMTGILLAIKLKEFGITDITILEKGNDVGGTWRENRYPGVACDVPAHAYTYSFEPNPNWNHRFAYGPQIQKYFRDVFEKYKLDEITKFNEPVRSCIWVEGSEGGRWHVKTPLSSHRVDLLFSATGILHHPVIPDIPGIEDFEGPVMHTARWDSKVQLHNKKIGVIGTGSTASQLIPALAKIQGTHVTVFQRTPQWLIKAKNKHYSSKELEQFKTNPQKIERIRKFASNIYSWGTSALTSDKTLHKMLHKLMEWNSRWYLFRSVANTRLREQLTPDYKFGCKRVIMNDGFYDAMKSNNVRLVTEDITSIGPEGVVAGTSLNRLDVLVTATGFDPTAYFKDIEFVGADGTTMADRWKDHIMAYRSMFIPENPNFFLMLGPNSPIGNQSVIEISERQIAYLLPLIKLWQEGGVNLIEARDTAMYDWNSIIKAKMKSTVWTSGCQSWYLAKDGTPLAWPDSWTAWCEEMEDYYFEDFKG